MGIPDSLLVLSACSRSSRHRWESGIKSWMAERPGAWFQTHFRYILLDIEGRFRGLGKPFGAVRIWNGRWRCRSRRLDWSARSGNLTDKTDCWNFGGTSTIMMLSAVSKRNAVLLCCYRPNRLLWLVKHSGSDWSNPKPPSHSKMSILWGMTQIDSCLKFYIVKIQFLEENLQKSNLKFLI